MARGIRSLNASPAPHFNYSHHFQRRSHFANALVVLISNQVLLFLARKESDSEYYTEACEAVASGEFKGVTLLPTDGKLPEIPKGQFYQALADSVAARLLPDKEKDH